MSLKERGSRTPPENGSGNGTAFSGPRGPSHWFSRVDLPPVPSLSGLPERAEVVVIGGGVMGVSTAYWLARRGADVLLLESRRLAWGASGRNGGFMLGSHTSLEQARAVMQEEGIVADYDEPGHLALASSLDVLDQMQQEVAARPQTAIPVKVIDRAECEELLRLRINARFRGGRWMARAATIHPTRFVYGLASAAVRRGARVVQATAALSVTRARRGDAIEVTTTSGRIRARHLVLACNVGTAQFLPELRKVLTPARGQMLSIRPLKPFFHVGLAVDWGTVYWRQSTDGTIVLGGYRNLDTAKETSARLALNPQIQRALSDFLPEAFPDFPASFTVSRRWAGIMDETTDGNPIVGHWPDIPNLWIVAGFGGHGFPPALGTGKALAGAIVDAQSSPEMDRFNPARFKQSVRS
jgi:glycine/D-amino acid oxidase-like deaminating enzyme